MFAARDKDGHLIGDTVCISITYGNVFLINSIWVNGANVIVVEVAGKFSMVVYSTSWDEKLNELH